MAAGVQTTGTTLTTASCNLTGTKILWLGINSILGTNVNTVVSSPTNTWTCNTQTTVSGNGSSQICYVISPTVSSSMTVSVTTTGGTTRLSLGLIGVPDTGTPGTPTFSSGLSGAGTTVALGSITPAAAGAYCFTTYSGNGLSGTAATISSPFSVDLTNVATFDSAIGHVQQTTATAAAPTWTGSDTQSSAQMGCAIP